MRATGESQREQRSKGDREALRELHVPIPLSCLVFQALRVGLTLTAPRWGMRGSIRGMDQRFKAYVGPTPNGVDAESPRESWMVAVFPVTIQ